MQKPESHRNPACLTRVVLICNNYLDKQFLPDTSTRFPMGSYTTSVLYETIVIYKEKVTGFIHPISKVLQWNSLSSIQTSPTQCLVLFSHDSTKMPYVNVENKLFSEHSRETSSWMKPQFSLGLAPPPSVSDGHCRPWAQATLSPVPGCSLSPWQCHWGGAVCLLLIQLCAVLTAGMGGMLGTRPHPVLSHRGRKRLVNTVHDYK